MWHGLSSYFVNYHGKNNLAGNCFLNGYPPSFVGLEGILGKKTCFPACCPIVTFACMTCTSSKCTTNHSCSITQPIRWV